MNETKKEKTEEKKIKIVYILPTLDKGGAERFSLDLILNLDRRVFAPAVILFKRGGEWLAELTAENIPVIIFKKNSKFSPRNFWLIFRALQHLRPQIVHTHLGGDLYGRLAARLLRVPVILSTEHNINADEKGIYRLLKRISNSWADKIVAVSPAVKKDIITRYKTAADKISVILNGLEINKFLARQKEYRPVGPADAAGSASVNRIKIFGTIGRLSPQKGHKVLLDALAKLNRPDIKGLIAGAGILEPELNKQIKETGMAERIKLVGPVSDPAAFLNSLDAFVFPSLWEGLGIVLLEAGLVGLPIIASAVDGITEIIDENTGWLVPAGDADALAAKIGWLADNLTTATVLAKTEKLREKIIVNFDIRKSAADYQTLYLSLLADKLENKSIN
jgi:glycosyltransferase involved in cell wall biosynthesis